MSESEHRRFMAAVLEQPHSIRMTAFVFHDKADELLIQCKCGWSRRIEDDGEAVDDDILEHLEMAGFKEVAGAQESE